MTNEALEPNEREAVTENVDIEATEAEVWAEEDAKEDPASKASNTDDDLQDDPDADTGDDPQPDGENDQPSSISETDNDPVAKIQSLEKELARRSEEQRRKDGHVSALQRKLNALEQRLKSAPATQDRADEEDPLKGLADDYPEIEKPLRASLEKVNKRVEDMTRAEQARHVEIQEDYKATQAEYSNYVAEQTAEINTALPDWQKMVGENQSAFRQWVDDQPKATREAAYRNADHIVDAREAIDVIGAFREHITGQSQPDPKQKPLNDKRERQLAAMSSPPNSKRKADLSGEPQEGDENAIWEAEEAKERRRNRA